MLILGGVLFFLRGSEDRWICNNETGEWVEHGVPNAPMPPKPCGDKVTCENYDPETCPGACVVCPPCMACSSISCQTEEFCADMGIDRDWYENLK